MIYCAFQQRRCNGRIVCSDRTRNRAITTSADEMQRGPRCDGLVRDEQRNKLSTKVETRKERRAKNSLDELVTAVSESLTSTASPSIFCTGGSFFFGTPIVVGIISLRWTSRFVLSRGHHPRRQKGRREACYSSYPRSLLSHFTFPAYSCKEYRY